LMRILTKKRVMTGFFARGMQPYPFLEETIYRKVFKKFITLTSPRKVFNAVYTSIALSLKRAGFVKPYDLLFTAGSEGFYTIGLGADVDLRTSNVVPINAIDVELSKRVLHSNRPFVAPYIVFLDEYLPYHPDFRIFKMETVTPEPYFKAMNDFFNRIETESGLSVVIAAHPKSDYANNPFGGRTILKNMTHELVRHSEMVIAHVSTAISYAVIFEKPIVLVYDREMGRIFKDLHIPLMESFGKSLNAPVLNLDESAGLPFDWAVIDREAYVDYKYKYLTSPGLETRNSPELIIEAIKMLRLPESHTDS
jgi:hypothetical protein